MDLSQQELGTIRDRIKRILDPHLEPNRALERANNITQALMLEDERAVEVAAEMLATVPVGNQHVLAMQVAKAWDSEIAAIKGRVAWSGAQQEPALVARQRVTPERGTV